MDIFMALAEPTRRKIIEMLAEKGELTATDISEQFNITPSAISQHLKVLREANLVQVERQGQQRIYSVDAKAISFMTEWVSSLNKRFDRLDKVLEQQKKNNN